MMLLAEALRAARFSPRKTPDERGLSSVVVVAGQGTLSAPKTAPSARFPLL